MTSEDYFSWRTETENHFQALATTQQLKGLPAGLYPVTGFRLFRFFYPAPRSFLPDHVFIYMTLILNYGLNVIKSRIIMRSIPCCSFACAQEKGVEWTPELFSSAKEMWQDACNFEDPERIFVFCNGIKSRRWYIIYRIKASLYYWQPAS
ncbi:hypothetical protein WDV93_06180 [Pantoea ananatis]